MMNLQEATRTLSQGQDLTSAQMGDVMRIIMQGDATPAQIGAVLTALHIKGETVEELTGAATVMREFAATVTCKEDRVADTVGTGGDGAGLFNVSTAAALVACAAGATMAKHGNRAATGNSGSADVLEAAGTKWNFLPFKPGLVGGHCIGVDPYYLLHKSEKMGYNPTLLHSSRTINNKVAAFVVDKTISLLEDQKISVDNSKVLILGYTFKENCA